MHKYVCICYFLRGRNGVHVVKIEREAYIMNFYTSMLYMPIL